MTFLSTMGFDCELAVVTGFKVGDEGDAKLLFVDLGVVVTMT